MYLVSSFDAMAQIRLSGAAARQASLTNNRTGRYQDVSILLATLSSGRCSDAVPMYLDCY